VYSNNVSVCLSGGNVGGLLKFCGCNIARVILYCREAADNISVMFNSNILLLNVSCSVVNKFDSIYYYYYYYYYSVLLIIVVVV